MQRPLPSLASANATAQVAPEEVELIPTGGCGGVLDRRRLREVTTSCQ